MGLHGNVGNGYAKIRAIDVIFNLNGPKIENCYVGDTYIDPGATAIREGLDVSNEIVITGLPLDTKQTGQKIITYEYTDPTTLKVYTLEKTIIIKPIIQNYDYTGAYQEFIAPMSRIL